MQTQTRRFLSLHVATRLSTGGAWHFGKQMEGNKVAKSSDAYRNANTDCGSGSNSSYSSNGSSHSLSQSRTRSKCSIEFQI